MMSPRANMDQLQIDGRANETLDREGWPTCRRSHIQLLSGTTMPTDQLLEPRNGSRSVDSNNGRHAFQRPGEEHQIPEWQSTRAARLGSKAASRG